MAFSSLAFIFYFLPVILMLYYMFFFSIELKNIVLVVCSLAFYAWGEPQDIVLLLVSVVANYFFGLFIASGAQKKQVARAWLICALIFNLGLLFVFKYLSFFLQNISYLTGGKIATVSITLPIGISFFTFQAISYAIDVFRKKTEPQKNILHFALYLSFFAKLTQGPIMQYAEFEPQILKRRETLRKFSAGSCLFIVGLAKKVLLANNMAIVADRIFEIQNMGGVPVSLAWLGAIAYTFQIYFDFSGYSDMAIGLGLMFGFKITRNFNYPYISKSIGEFWRRWHISLGAWFRDYLYIPLGGSRVKNKDRVIVNLAIVWILTGIWHGANWTFFIWGILNFICIALEKIFRFDESKVPNAIRHTYALFVIVIGWVIFRSDTIQEAGNYIACMFNFLKNGFFSDYTYMFLKEYWVFFLFACIFSMPVAAILNGFMAKGILLRESISPRPPYEKNLVYQSTPFVKLISVIYPIGMILLFMASTAYMVKGSYNPFIYFRF